MDGVCIALRHTCVVISDGKRKRDCCIYLLTSGLKKVTEKRCIPTKNSMFRTLHIDLTPSRTFIFTMDNHVNHSSYLITRHNIMPISQRKSEKIELPTTFFISMYGYYNKKNKSIEILAGGMIKNTSGSIASMICEKSIKV